MCMEHLHQMECQMRIPSGSGNACSGLLLGPRIAEARAAGHTCEESDLYEWNLRTQLRVWGTSPRGGSEVEDYANREWAGLISSYYRPRWVRDGSLWHPSGEQRTDNAPLSVTSDQHGQAV